MRPSIVCVALPPQATGAVALWRHPFESDYSGQKLDPRILRTVDVSYHVFSNMGVSGMGNWTKIGAVALMIMGIATPVVAQDQAADVEENIPHLPADSMELGAKYINYIMDYDAGDLFEAFSDEMKEQFESVGTTLDRMAGLFEQIGSQESVISQRYWMRNGKPQFWHTAKFSSMDEPIVIRIVIEPNGIISGIGFNPESQNPPVDNPEQHSTSDS
jgi:hypothetical protein